MKLEYTWLNWLVICKHITDEKRLDVIKANDEKWKLKPRDFEAMLYAGCEKVYSKYMGHKKFRDYIAVQLDIFINTGKV